MDIQRFSTLLSNISPYLRYANDSSLPANWKMSERVIMDYEIMYIKEGKGQVIIEDILYEAVSGDVFIFRPGIRHFVRNSLNSGLRQPHVHFDLFQDSDSEILGINFLPPEMVPPHILQMIRNDINTQSEIKLPDKIVLKNKANFEHVLFSLINEFHNSSDFSFLIYKSRIIDILNILLQEVYDKEYIHSSNVVNREGVDTVREYIRANYLQKLTLDELSRIANMSKNNFIRCFKKQLGMTPISYQIFLKIENAKMLLSRSNNNITEIALYLGFSNLQYFNKVFKKITGKSPTLYKKSHY